jgi:short-subunit dehydrogenase
MNAKEVIKLNKYVLITGASGGIGREIALLLAKEGYSLYLHYHQNKQVQPVKSYILQ